MEDTKEKGSNDELIIEGPERLEPGQNFYDQPPFDSLLRNAQLAIAGEPALARVSTNTLKDFLTKASNSTIKDTSGDEHKPYLEHVYENRARYQADPRSLLGETKVTGGKYGTNSSQTTALAPIALSLIDKLHEYPYWHEYIQGNNTSDKYGSEGNFTAKMNKPVPAIGYGEWLKGKVERIKRMRNLDVQVLLDETFSQTGQSVTSASGRPASNRTYRFLNAENLRYKEVKK